MQTLSQPEMNGNAFTHRRERGKRDSSNLSSRSCQDEVVPEKLQSWVDNRQQVEGRGWSGWNGGVGIHGSENDVVDDET